ncbi:UNVERIFIED_CONTAM: Heavy metal-associated isoprenylated plant protein 31 [Sesamum calycinum]|uniref:Heavy metal-associated isoprenylated plant protein 31 n=1 Tax=Sesamum calycinum TaxID=2727403 RepID=A0AAW2QVB5_9LAMI
MLEVRVPNLDCEGCAGKLRKALFKLKGVDEVDVDMELQKITVRGYALEEKSHYYDTSRNVAAPNVHTFFHTPAAYSVAVASDEAVASLFSDDNPHACSIM